MCHGGWPIFRRLRKLKRSKSDPAFREHSIVSQRSFRDEINGDDRLDINKATVEQLQTLPSINYVSILILEQNDSRPTL